ncbi:MAG: hypothetical protein PVF36_06300, partial [Desulfobacterales bacterium]
DRSTHQKVQLWSERRSAEDHHFVSDRLFARWLEKVLGSDAVDCRCIGPSDGEINRCQPNERFDDSTV